MLTARDCRFIPMKNLRRLLEFTLDHDASGPRLRESPPKNRQQLINQLYWLGVIQ